MPTQLGDMIKIGRRGSLNGRLRVLGTQGHVAYPQRADNPVAASAGACAALKAEPLDDGTDWFDASNLEITSIDIGNEATNVIPGEARVRFNIRFNDRWTPADARRTKSAAGCRRRGRPTGSNWRSTPATRSPSSPSRAQFTEKVAAGHRGRDRPRAGTLDLGGTSDARFIAQYGPVVEFGLVGKTMHQIDERVPVADIDGLTRVCADSRGLFRLNLEERPMPYVNIKITREGATQQKEALIAGVTQLFVDVLGENPKTTVVVIAEVETDNWGIGGESVTKRASGALPADPRPGPTIRSMMSPAGGTSWIEIDRLSRDDGGDCRNRLSARAS